MDWLLDLNYDVDMRNNDDEDCAAVVKRYGNLEAACTILGS